VSILTGNIEYADSDDGKRKFDYTNNMRDATIPKLHEHISSMGFNFMFLNMEDTEFFNRFPDGIPVYAERKTIENDYAFVFLDGPHSVEPIKLELDYFYLKFHKAELFYLMMPIGIITKLFMILYSIIDLKYFQKQLLIMNLR
jgi:hypothetical protein